MIDNNIKNQIKELALKEIPNEICGLILVSGQSNLIYPCKNISNNKNKFFELSPLDFLRAVDKTNNKVIGFYHSQEHRSPSALDWIVSQGHNLYSLIYSWKEDEFYEIDKVQIKYKDYLYKKFKWGVSDCFTLAKEFYKKEYNINVDNYNYGEDWYKKDSNLITDNYKKEGFIKIDFKEIKEGNVVVFSDRHFGIYLEKDLLLHSKRNKYSIIEPLTEEMKEKISFCLRYEK